MVIRPSVSPPLHWTLSFLLLLLALALSAPAQTLLNLDFGVGTHSAKQGLAGTGQSTNDHWNLYRHYAPRFVAGTPLVADGELDGLKLADGSASSLSVTVSNAPGVWGNASGDPMWDTYLFAQNGSNIIVTLHGLLPGSYYFYLYGHADPDVLGEQNSLFTLRLGTNSFGPLTAAGSGNWKTNAPLREYAHYVVFRDVRVPADVPVVIEVAPSPNGVAVLNGLQILSRGTSPPKLPVPALALADTNVIDPRLTNLIFREVRYLGRVSDREARFAVTLHAESYVTNAIAGPLFAGDVAVLATNLPPGARIVPDDGGFQLVLSAPGQYRLQFDLLAQITQAEPWHQVRFTGPPAAIGSLEAQADVSGVELQLANGTQLGAGESARVTGAIAADRLVALRWQSKTAEVTRKPLLTVDTLGRALVKPTGIEYTTTFRYEILQAPAPRLAIELPAGQTLTRLQGPQIRDWQVRPEGPRQVLTIDFIKPLEQAGELTLLSEQPLAVQAPVAELTLPQPLEVQREAGTLALSAEEMAVEVTAAPGLRQVNAPPGALVAYRFFGRPVTLTVNLKRIEPVITVADRVTARLEETRLLVRHALTLNVEQAGLYALDLAPPAAFGVADVKGEGLEDWKVTDGKLRVSFASRLLGARKLEVQLEQPHKTFPEQITVAALPVVGAAKQTVQIGAASALGIRLKTAGELTGVREIPVSALPQVTDELLAFAATEPDWQLVLAAERLPARVVAEVFNLITLGDGLVGGSATIRYGIINQGVQEFRVTLPAHWKNVEFIGPNIRRREAAAPAADGADTNHVVWTLSLQDKVWGGYTLVVTYDYPFDPHRALLDLGGAHGDGVERETGSLAVTATTSLELDVQFAAPLRPIDPAELADTDRALITRPVQRAFRYEGETFALTARLTRHDALDSLLNAVADRTQLTSVITDEGQMLSQASFMVKNNDKQFQRFQLPAGADLWGCYVNRGPVKAERDGDWLLVALPRGANRDEAFAVDIAYKQTFPSLKERWFPNRLHLQAPRTDVPNTYAEWTVYVPATERVAGFSGNMAVARGTTYGWRDGWQRFTEFYRDTFRERGGVLIAGIGLVVLIALVLLAVSRRGARGLVEVIAVMGLLALLAGMLLPALSKAKAKAQRINSVSSLKQIGLAARMWANDNGGVFPANYEQMREELGSEKILKDTASGEQFVWVGAGKNENAGQAVLAYSPVDINGRAVLFADGSVQQMNSEQFARALELDRQFARQAQVPAMAAAQQQAVQQAQGGPPVNASLSPPPTVPQPAGAASRGSAAPVMAGLGAIKIELPIAGQAYAFTKVLNISDEPLTVSFRAMPWRMFDVWRASWQIAALLVGLGLVWWEWRRRPARSLRFAVGLALALGAIGYSMVTARILHYWLIAAVPLLGGGAFLWVLWKLWPRKTDADTASSEPEPEAPPTGPRPSQPSAILPPTTLLLLGAAAVASLMSISALAAAPTSIANRQAPMAPPESAIRNPQSAILSATYTGRVQEQAAQFDVTLQLATFTTNQMVPLFGEDVALQAFATTATNASLLREGSTVSVRLPDAGTVTATARLVVKLGGDVTKRQLAFAIPPALASRFNLAIEETDADVEFPAAVSFTRTTAGPTTRVEAILGARGRVELFWTPRTKRATEVAASIFAQQTALVTLGAGAVNTRATINYQVAQGELRQARVRLPAGQRLLRVGGEWIRLWELREDGGQPVLVVDLVKPVAPAYTLTVEMEKPLDPLPARVTVTVPQTLEVIRETGQIGLRSTEELSLAIAATAELQRVDAADVARTVGVKTEELFSAYRFLKPEFQLAVHAHAVQSQLEAVVHNVVRLGFEQVTLTARVDYTVKQAGVFALRLALPAGYRVDDVTDGRAALSWREKDNPRTLEVTLKERTLGACSLRLQLARAYRELPETVAIAGVTPLDTVKLTGYVSVSADAGVAVKTAAFEGLTEIPALQLPDHGAARNASPTPAAAVLAFKFMGTDPQAAAPWTLSVATAVVESWVRAEVAHFVSVNETLLTGRSVIRYDIQNAPLKEFQVRVPAAWKNVDVQGTHLRRRDQTGADWRIELQTKVRGTYLLTFTWEQPRSAETNAASLTGLETLGTERETGWVIVQARPALQVTEQDLGPELLRRDARDLPAWTGGSATGAGREAEMPVLVYRYLRPGYRLAVESRRFDDAALLAALVEEARFTTVVADDGQMMTEMALLLRNHGLQHLAIELPAKARVWSAFVAGQPVRPHQRDGQLLLPLERTGDAPLAVELTYVNVDRFPRGQGRIELASPKLAAPLQNARWELYLPPDYEYTGFKGSMTHAPDAEPTVQVFSASEYQRQQKAKQVAVKTEFSKALSSVRSQLSTGNLKGANDDFNQALALNAYALQDQPAQEELQNLKRDLSQVQRSNLIEAQRRYTFENVGKLAGQGAAQPAQGAQQAEQATQLLQYDEAAADRQVGALQKAQEVAVARVEPLRANLPTRGQRHLFTQVLQTEVNQPLTIAFTADNAKSVSWFGRLVQLAGGFLMLWLFAAVVLHRTGRNHAPA